MNVRGNGGDPSLHGGGISLREQSHPMSAYQPQQRCPILAARTQCRARLQVSGLFQKSAGAIGDVFEFQRRDRFFKTGQKELAKEWLVFVTGGCARASDCKQLTT